MSRIDSTQVLDIAADAYVWGFPRMLFAKYLRDLGKIGAPLNQFFVHNRLATPAEIGTNVDTLYGFAWLDVGNEPVVLDVPDADERYYALQLIDVYSNNFHYIGRRTSGTRAQRFLIAGAGWQGRVPQGMSLVRSPSRGVFCFLRTLIDGPADLAAANRIQGGFCVAPLSELGEGLRPANPVSDIGPYFPKVHNNLDRLGSRFFDYLGDALAADPPTRTHDIEAMARFAKIGIGPGLHPADDPRQMEILAEAVRIGNDRIFRGASVNTVRNGWSVNLAVTECITDFLLKATVNKFIGTTSAEEAIYLMPTTLSTTAAKALTWASCAPDGSPLNGGKRYRLYFPSGDLPQVQAFWSLTLYDEKWSLYPNPLERYAFGDRTVGAKYGEDGSLEILIQHGLPPTGSSNWLPAPAGNFELILRAYQPSRAFLDGAYVLPALEIIG